MGMENFVLWAPTKVLFGKGQVDNVAAEILPYGKRVLFVYGQKHLKETGVYDRITRLLKAAGIAWIDYGGCEPNPRLSYVQKGAETCRREKVEFVLAAGGGSCSDAAKAIAAAAKSDFDIWQAFADFRRPVPDAQKKAPSTALPIGVVITKSATGSEFDLTSVVTKREEPTYEKLLLMNPVLYPRFAICDPTLAFTVPRDQTAYGVADMMSHYFEQYFGPSTGCEHLDRMKEGAIRTAIARGPQVVNEPTNYDARADLMYVAMWSCSMQTITGVIPEWTSHFIEHEITAVTDLQHGLGMALIFPAWMRYVVEKNPARFARFAERVWDVDRKGKSDVKAGIEGIEKTVQFWKSLGIPATLTQAGVSKSIFPKAAKQAARFGTMGSVTPINESDVLKILELAG
jgi:alcohol dehydrogenase YqhD (iron-dependent ADH family)